MGLGLDVRTGSSGDRPGLGRRRLGGAGVRSVGRRGPARGSLSEIIGVLDGLPVGRDDSADFSVAVAEPIGRPDAMEASSRGARAAPGAGGRGRGRLARSGSWRRRTRSRGRYGPAALGAWQRSRSGSRTSRTAAVSGMPARVERVADVDLERVERRVSRRAADRGSSRRDSAYSRYAREAARRLRLCERSGSMSRWEKDETSVMRFLARVTATLRRRSPPSLLQRAEAVEQPAVGVLAVADGEDDRVALVALDALEVLDEERLLPILVEELVELRRSCAQRSRRRLLDAVGVLDAHGDHAEGLVGPRLGVLEDQLDDALRPRRRQLASDRRPPVRERDEHVARHSSPATPGKVVSAAVVEVDVGEGDQPLVAAAVVPRAASAKATKARRARRGSTRSPASGR